MRRAALALIVLGCATQNATAESQAWERLLGWFDENCAPAGGFVEEGVAQRKGGIRDLYTRKALPKGHVLIKLPRKCLLSHKESLNDLKTYGLEGAFAPSRDLKFPPSSTRPSGLREAHATSVWLMAARLVPGHYFEPYFGVLPDDTSYHPFSWPLKDLRKKLPEFTYERVVALQNHVRGVYRSLELASPALAERFSYEDFLHAKLLVDARNFGGNVDNDDDFQLNMLPVIDSLNHGGHEHHNAHYRFVEETNEVWLETRIAVPAGGNLSITYGPHRTQEDLFVEYGFTLDCAHALCHDVATINYAGKYWRLEGGPAADAVAAAESKGLDAARDVLTQPNRGFLKEVVSRARESLDPNHRSVAAIASEAAAELRRAVDNATSALPATRAETTTKLAAAAPGSRELHTLRVIRGYHDVLDAWRALGETANKSPEAGRVTVRVSAEAPDGVSIGWLPGSTKCVDRHEACSRWAALRLSECRKNPDWMLANCPVSCGVETDCASPTPTPFASNLTTAYTSYVMIERDLLVATRGETVLFIREVTEPADVVVAG